MSIIKFNILVGKSFIWLSVKEYSFLVYILISLSIFAVASFIAPLFSSSVFTMINFILFSSIHFALFSFSYFFIYLVTIDLFNFKSFNNCLLICDRQVKCHSFC